MGIAGIEQGRLIIFSHIVTYGEAADVTITEYMRDEIETMWNEPHAKTRMRGQEYLVNFSITAEYAPDILPEEIFGNTDPRNNYFRIENYAAGNISFVDGLGCNTGYFLAENLYKGSTTAAHEYGHTLGLPHPVDLDIRGKGRPGIMYPRGTIVDPQYQYDPEVPAGSKGGTLYPVYRRVLQEDIEKLNLHRLVYQNGQAIIGEFSSLWHSAHDRP